MSNSPVLSCILPALLLSAALTIAGCASTVADHTATGLGGLPGDTPALPTTTSGYPAVNDLPPPRSSTLLSSEQQKTLEDELAEARKSAGTATSGTGKPAVSTASK